MDRKEDAVMPEWPEMETYRNLLAERIVGKQIIGTEITRDKSINIPADKFQTELSGRTVWFLEHRGKHLIFHLDDGKRLLLHLMLGGSLYFGIENRPKRTAQITLQFAHGNLYFNGLRLGYLHLLSVKETAGRLAGLGPEPFDKRLDLAAFCKRFEGKRGRLKTAMVDQSVIAGIGNCYADEIAFAAEVLPSASIANILPDTWGRIYKEMQDILRKAVMNGGYMEQPQFEGDELTGGYNDKCLVYDRGAEPCVRCGTPIVQGELSSRKVFYCPSCQKEA